MSDILAWVSLVLQVWTMGWPFTGQVRTKRTKTVETEINLGLYRRRVSWTERRDARR